jgi:NAD(P)H-flavin reductase
VGKDFDYYPGQWIDLYIPEQNASAATILANIPSTSYHFNKKVTGYSMICDPSYTKNTGLLELAIKDSKDEHPVTKWILNAEVEKDEFEIDGGQGNFFFYKNVEECSLYKNIVLIGGGIGGKCNSPASKRNPF